MPGVGPALLGELLDRHGAALVLFARQFCASPEDVVQEAFVQLRGRAFYRISRRRGFTAWCATAP